MKFIFLILGIIQITLAQNTAVHGISAEDATALHNAFAKLISDGSVINDFALKLEGRNGLDDQTINNIANVVVKEVSDYITSIASNLPNSGQFVGAVVSTFQELDVLQELLNKEGYNDEGIFAFILVGIYNDVVLTLKTMAEPFVQSIQNLQRNEIAPPKPAFKPDPTSIEKFKSSLTKVHQNIVGITEYFQKFMSISGNGQIVNAEIIKKINTLIQNILSTLDPSIAVNVKAMMNDVLEQIIIIMDIYEEYKGIDETKIIMQIVESAYKSAISSFYKLELQAEQLSNSASPANTVVQSEQDPYNGIPPPPPMVLENPESTIQVNSPSIPVQTPVFSANPESPTQNLNVLQQIELKAGHDMKSLISLMRILKERNGKDDLVFSSILGQTVSQFMNIVSKTLINQPELQAEVLRVFNAIYEDIVTWEKMLEKVSFGNQGIETVFADLIPKIVNDIFNYFYSATMRDTQV